MKESAYLIFKLESSQHNHHFLSLSLAILKDFPPGYHIPQRKEDDEEEEIEVSRNDDSPNWDRDVYEEDTSFKLFYSVESTCLVPFLSYFFGF